MEVFPESPVPTFPLPLEAAWKTSITDFESGKEQRQRRWAFPKRSLKLGYRALADADLKLLWQFYQGRQGSYEAFWFYYPVQKTYYREYVGLGTGTSITLDLPSKSTDEAGLVLYADGIVISKTFISGGGQGNSDRVTFTATSGAMITADFTGLLRLKARFLDDKLNDELFTVLLYNASLGLVEVR